MRAELVSDRGEGPALVYVPGIDGTGALLLGQAEGLERRLRLLRLRYVEGAEDSYETLAESVVDTLDSCGVGRALLLAESFGGGVALHAALAFPERIAGLALVNGFCFYEARLKLWLARLGAPLVPGFVFRTCRQRAAPLALFGKLREADAIARFRALPGIRFDRAYRTRLRMIAGLDLRRALRRVTQPVALYAGTQDRIVDAQFQALYMRELLPDARIDVVRGGGHLLLPLARLPWPDWLAGLAERAELSPDRRP